MEIKSEVEGLLNSSLVDAGMSPTITTRRGNSIVSGRAS